MWDTLLAQLRDISERKFFQVGVSRGGAGGAGGEEEERGGRGEQNVISNLYLSRTPNRFRHLLDLDSITSDSDWGIKNPMTREDIQPDLFFEESVLLSNCLQTISTFREPDCIVRAILEQVTITHQLNDVEKLQLQLEEYMHIKGYIRTDLAIQENGPHPSFAPRYEFYKLLIQYALDICQSSSVTLKDELCHRADSLLLVRIPQMILVWETKYKTFTPFFSPIDLQGSHLLQALVYIYHSNFFSDQQQQQQQQQPQPQPQQYPKQESDQNDDMIDSKFGWERKRQALSQSEMLDKFSQLISAFVMRSLVPELIDRIPAFVMAKYPIVESVLPSASDFNSPGPGDQLDQISGWVNFEQLSGLIESVDINKSNSQNISRFLLNSLFNWKVQETVVEIIMEKVFFSDSASTLLKIDMFEQLFQQPDTLDVLFFHGRTLELIQTIAYYLKNWGEIRLFSSEDHEFDPHRAFSSAFNLLSLLWKLLEAKDDKQTEMKMVSKMSEGGTDVLWKMFYDKLLFSPHPVPFQFSAVEGEEFVSSLFDRICNNQKLEEYSGSFSLSSFDKPF